MRSPRQTLSRLSDGLATVRGRRLSRYAQWAVQGVVAGLLLWQLSRIGWEAVVAALPKAPPFYLFLIAAHLTPALVAVLVYVPVWHTRPMRTLGAALRQTVLNQDLADYSGEAYLGLWAVSEGVERGKAFRTIRDVSILSAGISTASTVVAVVLALAFGTGLDLPLSGPQLLGLAALPLALQFAVVLVLRRHIFALPLREVGRLGVLNVGRVLAVAALTVGMWAVAAPAVPLQAWLSLLALQMGLARVPFLPAKDIVFAGAGVGLAGALGMASETVAGLLIGQVAVTKAINLLLLTLPIGRMRPPVDPLPDTDRAGVSRKTAHERVER